MSSVSERRQTARSRRSVAFGRIRARLPVWLGALAIAVAQAGTVSSQELAGPALVEALREGGYNIYFRHAETDWSDPDRVEAAGDWTSCDPNEMRQLSDTGRITARRIGDAMRALRIPVGQVLSSEYCRAVETARLLDLGEPETTRDIMNTRAAAFVGGLEAVVRRARRVLASPPPTGTNTVIVGHGNLMRAATAAYPTEGGSGIFVPRQESDLGFEIVAQLAPDDWADLVASMRGDAGAQ
jgi:phosphohistidine phosphatase SixA